MGPRFLFAVHACAFLAVRGAERSTSEQIAASVQANVTTIRSILADLSRAGLVEGVRGRGGGVWLARRPESLRLSDVFDAVSNDAPIIGEPSYRPAPACGVGQNVQAHLERISDAVADGIRARLAKITLASLLSET